MRVSRIVRLPLKSTKYSSGEIMEIATDMKYLTKRTEAKITEQERSNTGIASEMLCDYARALKESSEPKTGFIQTYYNYLVALGKIGDYKKAEHMEELHASFPKYRVYDTLNRSTAILCAIAGTVGCMYLITQDGCWEEPFELAAIAAFSMAGGGGGGYLIGAFAHIALPAVVVVGTLGYGGYRLTKAMNEYQHDLKEYRERSSRRRN